MCLTSPSPKNIYPKGRSDEDFLECDVLHLIHTKLYTYGSRLGSGIGSAKLPDCTSIFPAELIAVVGALDLILQSSDSKFVMYSDSRNTGNY